MQNNEVFQELALIREVLRSLHLSLSELQRQQSLHQQHALQQAVVLAGTEKLWISLQRCWDELGTLELRIYPYYFWWGKEALIAEEEDEAQLPFLFFSHGIRKISFQPNMSRTEVAEFLALLLKLCLSEDAKQFDLATELWIKQLPNLQFEESDPLAELDEKEGWELEAIFAELYDLREQYPFQTHNFIAQAMPNIKRDGPDDAGTSLSGWGNYFSEQERADIQELLATEDRQLPLRASDLFLLVLCHCREESDIKPLASWLEPIAQSLIAARNWFALAFLVEDIVRIGTQLPTDIQQHSQQMCEQLLGFLTQPQRLSVVFKWLGQIGEIAEAEQTGLRAYIRALIPHIKPQIFDQLANSKGGYRRVLLEILLQTKLELPDWNSLLSRFSGDTGFILDLLAAGRNSMLHLPLPWLLELSHSNNPAIQIEVLTTLAAYYPEHAITRASMLCNEASGELQKAAIEILCKTGESGLSKLCPFLQSNTFYKLPHNQQEGIYRTLGKNRSRAIIQWLHKQLAQKSKWMRSQIDREKLLAIQALATCDTPEAWQILELALQDSDQPKHIIDALNQALQMRITPSSDKIPSKL